MLFLTFVLLYAVSWFLYAAGTVFGVREMGQLLVVGAILAVWISFVVVVQLSLATSLYLAKRASRGAAGERHGLPRLSAERK